MSQDSFDARRVCVLTPRFRSIRRSAADSVMSLPLLNMVRGVPFSHRGSCLRSHGVLIQ